MKNGISYLFFLFLLLPFTVMGQQKGVVKGHVLDAQTRQPVPYASVQVWNTTIGVAADSNGFFRIEGVPLGYNRLEVRSVGYAAKLSEEFMVNTAAEREVRVELMPESVSLEQVSVKASPYRRNTVSPVSLQRIGLAEIEKNPGGNRDISKVLQSMPGVLSSPAFRNDFIVRGGGPSENRFFLDDVELPNLNHFATQGASGGVVSIVNVDFVKEVDFYAGAFPASRGNMLSSLLEFKQVSGNTARVRGRATLGATDFGVSADGPLSPRTTFIVSARRSYLKFLFDMIGLPFLPVYNDFQFKTETRFDAKNVLTVLGIGAYDVNNLNTGLKDPDDDQQYILNYLPESVQWSYTLGATFRHYGEGWNHLFVLSRSTLQNEVEKFKGNDESQQKLVDYNSGESENKFRFEHNRVLPRGIRLNAGLGLEYATYKNKTSRELFLEGEEQLVRYDHRFSFFKWALFGQAAKSWREGRLSLALGLRLDGNSYAGSMANPLRQVSPRFSLSYGLAERWFLNANVGRYFQLPSYTTMGYADADGNLVNKRHDLKYIASNHYVAGIEFRPDDLTRVSVEGFYKTYSRYPVSLLDSVVLANKGTDYVAVGDEPVVSTGEGRSYGVELMIRTREFKGIVASLAYTLYWSEFKEMDGELRPASRYVASSWDNRHVFSLTATRKFGPWDFGVKWRYAGGAPFTPYDEETSSLIVAWDVKQQPYLDYSRFNTGRASAFHQLDIRVDRSLYFRNWSVTLYADIQNVYNHKTRKPDLLVPAENPDGSYQTDPERPGHYRMRYIKNEEGTLLPSIGIMIDF